MPKSTAPKTTVGTIVRLERLPSSVFGNPRFLLHLEDGRALRTQPDVMWAYGAENPEYRGGPVTMHLSRGCVAWTTTVAEHAAAEATR